LSTPSCRRRSLRMPVRRGLHARFRSAISRTIRYPYVRHASLGSARRTARSRRATSRVDVRTDAEVAAFQQVAPDRVEVQLASGDTFWLLAPSRGWARSVARPLRGFQGRTTSCRRRETSPTAAQSPTTPSPTGTAKTTLTWWVGPGMHLIQYPLRRRELYNQVAVIVSRRSGNRSEWGRFLSSTNVLPGLTSWSSRCGVGRPQPQLGDGDRAPISRWTRGASRCSATQHTRCCSMSLRAAARRWRMRNASPSGLLPIPMLISRSRSTKPRAFDALVAFSSGPGRLGELVHADGLLADLRNEVLRLREPKTSISRVAVWGPGVS